MRIPRNSFLVLLGMAAFSANFAFADTPNVQTIGEEDAKTISESAKLTDKEKEEIRIQARAEEIEAIKFKQKQ